MKAQDYMPVDSGTTNSKRSLISVEQMSSVLSALPDPAFLLSRRGKYLAVFGGRDSRYYHDGSDLVGSFIADLISPEKAQWFIEKINLALQSKTLLIEEYELSKKDIKGLANQGPEQPIWFEGRIQALDFLVDNEEVVLWVASNISKRHQMEIDLRELSDTDQPTGLYNRRRLERDLLFHYDIFIRHSVPTSVLIIDLDNFKQINDVLGHYAGDEALLAVADICRAQLRKTDTAYRFGGDEFVVALPGIDLKHAVQFADRLRKSFKCELTRFSIDGRSVTVSTGVATMLPTDQSYEVTLKRADKALYEAKRCGRDNVVLA